MHTFALVKRWFVRLCGFVRATPLHEECVLGGVQRAHDWAGEFDELRERCESESGALWAVLVGAVSVVVLHSFR